METTMEELAPYMRGWRSYFGFCETPEVLIGLTRWVRLRLRAAMWRQWKTPRRRRAALLELGVREPLASNTAGSGRGPWYLAKAKALAVGLSNAYFKSLGLPSLFENCKPNRLEPPCTDPYARWCGRGRRVTVAPMPIHPTSTFIESQTGKTPRLFFKTYSFLIKRLGLNDVGASPPTLPRLFAKTWLVRRSSVLK